MSKQYKIVELFSGIGSQAKALKNIGLDIKVNATCEWDIHAFVAYDAIHNNCENTQEIECLNKKQLVSLLNRYTLSNNGKVAMAETSLSSYDIDILRCIYQAIIHTKNLVDIKSIQAYQMNEDTDILTYSFPCQDLSNVGAFHGYNKGIDINSGSRSSLLWQVGRILKEMRNSDIRLPKFLVMENVPTLLSNRHSKNFEKWKHDLAELGYMSQEYCLNARNFGIPQNRPRLLMMSIFVGDDEIKRGKIRKYFEHTTSKSIVDDYRASEFYQNISICDLLRVPMEKGTMLWEEAIRCVPNDTVSRRKIWNENPVIIDENGKLTECAFIRTITTKQDRNPNSGNIYFDTGIENKSKFRYLTPRECMLFMGFTETDYEHIIDVNEKVKKGKAFFSRDTIIRLAGNSIPVKLLEGFFYQLRKIEEIME